MPLLPSLRSPLRGLDGDTRAFVVGYAVLLPLFLVPLCLTPVLPFLDAPFHVAINDEIVAISVALGVKHRLRGCDALQLAAAVALKKATGRLVRFICADADLNVAARAEGLSVLDPSRTDKPN